MFVLRVVFDPNDVAMMFGPLPRCCDDNSGKVVVVIAREMKVLALIVRLSSW